MRHHPFSRACQPSVTKQKRMCGELCSVGFIVPMVVFKLVNPLSSFQCSNLIWSHLDAFRASGVVVCCVSQG